MTDDYISNPIQKAKVLTGKPGRPKGVEILGAKDAAAGGTVIEGQTAKGVTILDKSTKTVPDPSSVVITQGEENGGNGGN